MKNIKPLGIKSYGSIPHLTGSKVGQGDYHCHFGQERILTERVRDKHDIIIVQEKLDGCNVGVAKFGGEILALTRSGYMAYTSPYETHWIFEKWVMQNEKRFDKLLNEGERVCGEWLYHAVGTRYVLPHDPFVAFDIMKGSKRESYFSASARLRNLGFITPYTLHIGESISAENALANLFHGKHGAVDPVEGIVYRVERKGEVDFLAKYVKPTHQTGRFLPEISGNGYIKNEFIQSSLSPGELSFH